MESFAKRIKELRVAAGYSQEKLAEQLEIAVKSIQRYEKGYRPDTYTLVKMATFFNVSTDYLLGLISYEKLIKEHQKLLLGGKGYNHLYAHYLKCLNDYEIVESATYYWIELGNTYIGGQSIWVGWADEERKLEIRKLRPVKPRKAIASCTKVKGRPMVLNSQLDASIFLIYGGQAIVREDICKEYLPEFMKEVITENPELIARREFNERQMQAGYSKTE